MKLVHYNEYSFRIVDTDGLVILHQGIRSHNADLALIRFPIFKG